MDNFSRADEEALIAEADFHEQRITDREVTSRVSVPSIAPVVDEDLLTPLDEIESALISIAEGTSPEDAVRQAFDVINRERLKLGAALASTVAPQQSEPTHDYAVTVSTQCLNCGGGIADYWTYCHRCGADRANAPASPAALRDEAALLSGSADPERLDTQEDKPVKNYDDFRAGMLRAAEIARNEFKRAPEAAKGHDCVYMGGYEDACDHLSAVIAQAAVIDSVRIAGPQPDWQYHISLLLPDGIEDTALLKIYQIVEHELRIATTPPSTAADKIADQLIPHLDHAFLLTKGWRDQIASIIERCLSK